METLNFTIGSAMTNEIMIYLSPLNTIQSSYDLRTPLQTEGMQMLRLISSESA